ncbi:MAG: hypothetical protein ACRDF4_09530 [Rhabdochlamydiaceae bacterium]
MQLAIQDENEPDQVFDLIEKTFASGSRGYWAGGKLEYQGRKYQCTFTLVEIGSKPK